MAGNKGQVKPCEAPLHIIGPIREEIKISINDYQQEKARDRAIQDEIGKKRNFAANPTFDYEGSSSIPSTGVRDPFRYVPPPPKTEKILRLTLSLNLTLTLKLEVKEGLPSKVISHPPTLLVLTMPMSMFLKVNPIMFSPP